MAVAGLLEHLCSLMDTQPSESYLCSLNSGLSFFRTGGRKWKTHLFRGRFGRKWTKWNVTDIKNKRNVP